MTERPHNVKPARILERSYANSSYNSRRLIAETRTDENQIANRSYNGSHRADSMHHSGEHSAAQQRSSRVGRHHADRDDRSRW
ncbi:hypothetical protein ACWKSP_20465 [Micromonosporaceae bacterium Da 78-11]